MLLNTVPHRTLPYPLFLNFLRRKTQKSENDGVGYGASTVRNSRTLRQGDVDDKI